MTNSQKEKELQVKFTPSALANVLPFENSAVTSNTCTKNLSG